jgi:hypothetical protein
VSYESFFEVFVAEDVGSGANQAEADSIHAAVAGREVIVGDHHDFVSGAMLCVVYNFVDSGFEDAVTGAIQIRMVSALFGWGVARISLIPFEPCRT